MQQKQKEDGEREKVIANKELHLLLQEKKIESKKQALEEEVLINNK